MTSAETMPRVASVNGMVRTTTSASWTASRRASSPTIRSGIDPSGSPVPGTRKAMSRRSDGRDFTAMMRIPRDDSWRATSRPIDP